MQPKIRTIRSKHSDPPFVLICSQWQTECTNALKSFIREFFLKGINMPFYMIKLEKILIFLFVKKFLNNIYFMGKFATQSIISLSIIKKYFKMLLINLRESIVLLPADIHLFRTHYLLAKSIASKASYIISSKTKMIDHVAKSF